VRAELVDYIVTQVKWCQNLYPFKYNNLPETCNLTALNTIYLT